MGYASISDLATYGIPTTAFGTLTDAIKLANLESASAKVDAHLRGRTTLPLIAPIDPTLVEATCVIAAWQLINVRGYNAGAGADTAIRDRYILAMEYLGKAQRQAAHPSFTPSTTDSPTYTRPTVISSSATSTGSARTSANRGY